MVLVTDHLLKHSPCSMLISIFPAFFFHLISQPHAQIFHHFCSACRQQLLVRQWQEREDSQDQAARHQAHIPISGHTCLFWTLYSSSFRASHLPKRKKSKSHGFCKSQSWQLMVFRGSNWRKKKKKVPPPPGTHKVSHHTESFFRI